MAATFFQTDDAYSCFLDIGNGFRTQTGRRTMNARMAGHASRLRDSPMDFAYDSPSRQRIGPSRLWLDNTGASSSQQSMDVELDESAAASDTALLQQPLSPTETGPDVDMMAVDIGANAEPIPTSSAALTRVSRQRSAARTRSAKTSSGRRTRPALKADVSLDADEEDEDLTIDETDDSIAWQDETEDNGYNALGTAKGKNRSSRRRSLRKRVGDTLNIQYFFNNASERQDDAHHHQRTSDKPVGWTDPEWCLGMAQFGFNATLLVGITYILFNVIVTLQRDVSNKVREYELEYLAEIETCSQNYHLNRCGTSGAVPALASACASWQRCSARNPANVGRARVAAETVAEIVNGFVDVVSWKSMLFTLLTLIIVVGATNSFLSFFRIRSRATHTPQQHATHMHSHPQQQTARRLHDSMPRRRPRSEQVRAAAPAAE